MSTTPAEAARRYDFVRVSLVVGGLAGMLVAIALLWRWPFGSDVTLSLAATTQVLAFDLVPERAYVWRLPAGDLSSAHLEDPTADVDLRIEESIVLTLRGAARVTFEMASSGQLVLNVVPDREATPTNRLRASARGANTRLDLDEFAELAFVSREPAGFLRLPVIATNVTIGRLLSDVTAEVDLEIPYQPILLGGDARFFARAGSGSHRYLVLEGTLDPADVVTVDSEATAKSDEVAWLSLTWIATAQPDRPSHIDVRLHASTRRVMVTRLHAPEGYLFGVTPWQILSTRPAVQYAWVSLASAILLLGFMMNVTNFFSTQRAIARPAAAKDPEAADETG